ncbi:restriction endonuclease [candidate division WOR-3 bacterium]|nr:restriction endonuclease [candidate division WOR-3 bacterium]
MDVEGIRKELLTHFDEFKHCLVTDSGDWTVKGFIDVYRNIYTISRDTKVVSKIIELMLFPLISRFAVDHSFQMVLSDYQNHYPDVSFIARDSSKIALDLKSTYRKDGVKVNGFTLSAFTGYFRQRDSTKNIKFAYKEYAAHLVLGVIYSRKEEASDEIKLHNLEDLQSIVSVAEDFDFLLQEKWRIASDRPGSGNTKNIGSITNIGDLIEGKGPFVAYDKNVFDDYWMNYLTKDMARAIDSKVPYHNLEEYLMWPNRIRSDH